MQIDLSELIRKLNPTCRRALEQAAGLCVAQTHYNVEVEHLLINLLEMPRTDLGRLLRYYDLDPAAVTKELHLALESFKRGNSRTPVMSPQILRLLREAWMLSSVELGTGEIRSGAMLPALLDDEELRRAIVDSCPALAKIPRGPLREKLRELLADFGDEPLTPTRPEEHNKATPPSPSPEAPPAPPAAAGTAMDRYTIDLTAEARAGRIDPIRARETEIRRVIDILTRRRQNNPILVGEAGVGKTAVAEGFALRLAAGEVPSRLRQVSLRILDLGLLQAGAGIRGEFEKRLKSVISEVEGSPTPVILFIDEAHTLIGAGGAAGQGDAANLLKPALARGELRTIAATTWSEYKRYFEKDAALARRFQVVKVDEPGEEDAIEMLRGVAAHLERHHHVPVLDQAIRDAVRLSHRYITGRRLPDKAISVLDTACARVALARDTAPPALEEIDRRLGRSESEKRLLEREQASGADHAAALARLTEELDQLRQERQTVAAQWRQEAEIVRRISGLESELDDARDAEAGDPQRAQELGAGLAELRAECAALQGPEPMVPMAVDEGVIAAVVSDWTGIPTGRMLTDEIHAVLGLRQRLGEHIIGQPQALEAICRRISTSRAELEDPGKPKGVFLLAGPTGVGKTETAAALAELLYGGARNLVTVHLSEFQEAHTGATLKGAPPGYVGYGKGGVLTEAVRRKPYCVVLLDEMEKAHPDVVELFFQVFDKGILDDGEGVPVDFKNTVILLTTNVGSEAILTACRESPARPDPQRLLERMRPELLRRFRPALLGRLVVVPYYPLGDDEIAEIVRLKLAALRRRVRENHRAELSWEAPLVDAVVARCTEVESGARTIDQILTQTLLPELSAQLLERMAAGKSFSAVRVTVDEAGGFAYSVDAE